MVDDGSTDRTRAVAQSFPGVTVVDGEPVPEGWTGKSWACWQGARLALGRLLVFVDADVCFGSSALGLVVTRAASQGGLFSVVPYHRVQRRYEQLSAPFSLVSVMGVGAAAVGRPRVHGAFGPCLACSIEDYFEVGGHRSVRDRVIDDVALAERFSVRGLPVEVVGGGDAISYRMYPSGLAQLWRDGRRTWLPAPGRCRGGDSWWWHLGSQRRCPRFSSDCRQPWPVRPHRPWSRLSRGGPSRSSSG